MHCLFMRTICIQAAEQLLDRHIDVLINCAGISSRGSVVETQIEVDRRLMDVNFWGAVALTKAVLPGKCMLAHYEISPSALSLSSGKAMC
jgi:short-subunit dehydrogenase